MKAKIESILVSEGVSSDNISFLMGAINRALLDEYANGYTECVKHIKKKREIRRRNVNAGVKGFLDYLHDITHGL